MTDFKIGDHIKFAGGRGEITKIEDRPNGGHLLHVDTSEGQLRKLPSGLPHIEKLDSLVDRLAAGQSDAPLHYDLREPRIRVHPSGSEGYSSPRNNASVCVNRSRH